MSEIFIQHVHTMDTLALISSIFRFLQIFVANWHFFSALHVYLFRLCVRLFVFSLTLKDNLSMKNVCSLLKLSWIRSPNYFYCYCSSNYSL